MWENQRERQIDRQTERQTARQADRHTDREKDRQTNRTREKNKRGFIEKSKKKRKIEKGSVKKNPEAIKKEMSHLTISSSNFNLENMLIF